MLKIGEFAALTGISIYMLRNYDKIGLLRPDEVDNWSGYRYYNERQIVDAGRIQVLKNLGFGLKEIATIQEGNISGAAMEAFLKDKMEEKRIEIEEAKHQLRQMEYALRDLDMQDHCALSVFVKVFPARRVVRLRDTIADFPEEGLLWQRLDGMCREHKVKLADVRYSFAITHKVDFENHRIDTEVQRIVDADQPRAEGLEYLSIPKMEVASVAYRGVYSRIGDINKHIFKWIEENNYTVCGNSFQAYYVSPEHGASPESFITEVCFPVVKNKD